MEKSSEQCQEANHGTRCRRENQIESDRINVYVRTYGVRISSGSRPFLVYLCNVWLLCQDCSKSKIDCRPSIFQALTAFCSIKLWCVRFYLINLLIEYCFYTFGLCWIRKKRILPIEIEQNRNAEKKMSDNEVDYRWWVDKSNIFTLIRGPIVESGWFLLFASFFCLYFHHDLYLPVLSRKKMKKAQIKKCELIHRWKNIDQIEESIHFYELIV